MIIVHGTANAFNESLQYVLSHELGIPCELQENGEALDSVLCEPNGCGPQILLIDGSDGLFEETLRTSWRRSDNGPSGVVLAIFNLPRGMTVRAEALRRGVRGLFFADDGLAIFLKGVRALLKGEVWLSRIALLEAAIDDQLFPLARVAETSGLSRREMEILSHLSRGETNDEISDSLSVSTHTVKTHLYNIYRKINVNNRFQASLWAAKNIN